MNCANAKISGSENGFGPAYIFEQGSFDTPTSETIHYFENEHIFTSLHTEILFNSNYLHDESQSFYLHQLPYTIALLDEVDVFFATNDS